MMTLVVVVVVVKSSAAAFTHREQANQPENKRPQLFHTKEGKIMKRRKERRKELKLRSEF